ncbi:MAG: hypothetical protein OHK0024_09670 [Thalassobaculales bacterium]
MSLEIAEAGLAPENVAAETALIEAIRRDTWPATYQAMVPAEVVAAVRAAPGHPPAGAPGVRSWLARRGGDTLGYVSVGPARDPLPPWRGEVYALYVRPGAQGGGAGRALMARALSALHGDGRWPAWLWVLADNARARRFYEKAGGRLLPETDSFTFRGTRYPGIGIVGYGWEGALP